MEVANLTGVALDTAVAKALGYVHHGAIGLFAENPDKPWCVSERNDWWRGPDGKWICADCLGFPYPYSREWEHGGPVIEAKRIEVSFMGDGHGWQAAANPFGSADWCLTWVDGETALIAAMRALVATSPTQP